MNPDQKEEYWRLINTERDAQYASRKANPSEGDVVHDAFGTQVYLGGEWKVVDYNKPDEVQELREQWVQMAHQKRLTESFNRISQGRKSVKSTGVHLHQDPKHKGTDFGRADLDKYFKDGIPEEKVYTEVELDNATLEAYTQGKQNFGKELLELLAAEEADLKSYGRTELYGIHKAVSIIQQALDDIQ